MGLSGLLHSLERPAGSYYRLFVCVYVCERESERESDVKPSHLTL